MPIEGNCSANVPGHSELRKGLHPKPVDQRHPIPLPLFSRVGLAGVEIALIDVPNDVEAALLMDDTNAYSKCGM